MAELGYVLLVEYPLFARDFAAWLEERGYRVEWLVPQALTVELMRTVCRVLAPRFVASINWSPELALLAALTQTPYVSWTIDPLGPERFELYPGTDPSLLVAFAHRQRTAERLRALGIANAAFLPLAASPRRRKIEDEEQLAPYVAPITFVGSSLFGEAKALERKLGEHGAGPELVAAAHAFVERALDEHEADPDYAGLAEDGSDLPEELWSALPRKPARSELADGLNGALSHGLRRRAAEALASAGLVVYGDDGWRETATTFRGAADHGDELTRIYSASLLSLDVPRVYQRDIVTMRVFDIMAVGGVVLSEPSEDLRSLFTDGVELLTYRGRAELRAKADAALAAPETRAALAEAGRAKVLAEHRLEHRFARIAEAVAARGWS